MKKSCYYKKITTLNAETRDWEFKWVHINEKGVKKEVKSKPVLEKLEGVKTLGITEEMLNDSSRS